MTYVRPPRYLIVAAATDTAMLALPPRAEREAGAGTSRSNARALIVTRSPVSPWNGASRFPARTFGFCIGFGMTLVLGAFLVTLLAGVQGSPTQVSSAHTQVNSATSSKLRTTRTTGRGPFLPVHIVRRLSRLSQLDPGQYSSSQEYNLWAYSACSAASMTEVLNAYGHAYRITDILKVESHLGEITPQLGLLEDAGIARTVAQFGFKTLWGHNLSLDALIAIANHGQPVIVSFPPAKYAGGHLLVVTGGSGNAVYLADSSLWNRRALSRGQFLHWWGGFSAIVTPQPPPKGVPTARGGYSVEGKPSLSVDFMNSVLRYYHSPAAGKAQALFDDGLKYGLDPAYALAFFMHESSFGTAGVAQTTLSLSNMRCAPEYACFNENGGYAQFNSWEQGFEAWFKLIRNLYIGQWGLVTVDQIIPVYAPSSDHNDVSAYIASLKHIIDTWHSGTVQVS